MQYSRTTSIDAKTDPRGPFQKEQEVSPRPRSDSSTGPALRGNIEAQSRGAGSPAMGSSDEIFPYPGADSGNA